MSNDQTYLKWLSSIPVSATDLRQALNQCGEPNTENGGFWGYSMTIGSLHPSNPAKANAILSRLEALWVTIPCGPTRSWSLHLSEQGVTLESRHTLGAAAIVPLQRREDQMTFDRDTFITQALQIRAHKLRRGTKGGPTTEFCSGLGA